jgi:hypothetical protein
MPYTPSEASTRASTRPRPSAVGRAVSVMSTDSTVVSPARPGLKPRASVGGKLPSVAPKRASLAGSVAGVRRPPRTPELSTASLASAAASLAASPSVFNPAPATPRTPAGTLRARDAPGGTPSPKPRSNALESPAIELTSATPKATPLRPKAAPAASVRGSPAGAGGSPAALGHGTPPGSTRRQTPRRVASVLRLSDLGGTLLSPDATADSPAGTPAFELLGAESVDGSVIASLWADDDDDVSDVVTLDGEGPMDDEVPPALPCVVAVC